MTAGISATPVRDALIALSAEGLIAWSPTGGGFCMPAPSQAELVELYLAAQCLTNGLLKLNQESRRPCARRANLPALTAARPDILSRLLTGDAHDPAFPETYVKATERLFEDIAGIADNRVIPALMRQVSARLYFARLLEPVFFDDAASELDALDIARRNGDMRDLAKRLDKYHKRRAKIVFEIFKEAVTRRFSA